MTNSTRFPQTVKFLQSALLGNGDVELAQELTKLVNALGQAETDNVGLRAENEVLVVALEVAKQVMESINEAAVEPLTPQFPQDFYQYGQDIFTDAPSNDDIQDAIDVLHDEVLEDGQFLELTNGDTLVIKLRSDGVERIVVAKGYYDAALLGVASNGFSDLEGTRFESVSHDTCCGTCKTGLYL